MKRLLGMMLLVLMVACHPVTIPVPQPPVIVDPVLFDVGVVALDELSKPVVGASCQLEAQTVVTNSDGYGLFKSLQKGEKQVVCIKDAYTAGATTSTLSENTNVTVSLFFLNQMPRLATEGQHLITAIGPFTAIEASDFALYQRFLDGGDIRGVLQQRQEYGFNMVRVFGMYHGTLGAFLPAQYRDSYFTMLPNFYRFLAHYGLYGEFVAFADSPLVMPDGGAQLAHWGRLVDTLRPIPNALVEAVNEADQPANFTVALGQLPQPTGLLSSHGSNGSQAWPVQPFWDYATFHTNDAPEWQRKTGHNAMEIWSGPTIANENTRAPDRYTDPRKGYDAAAGATLLAAGSSFHSVSGKASVLFDAVEQVFAREWVIGAKSISLECQDGPYIHRADLETPGVLRAYQRGSDPECVVLIRQ